MNRNIVLEKRSVVTLIAFLMNSMLEQIFKIHLALINGLSDPNIGSGLSSALRALKARQPILCGTSFANRSLIWSKNSRIIAQTLDSNPIFLCELFLMDNSDRHHFRSQSWVRFRWALKTLGWTRFASDSRNPYRWTANNRVTNALAKH